MERRVSDLEHDNHRLFLGAGTSLASWRRRRSVLVLACLGLVCTSAMYSGFLAFSTSRGEERSPTSSIQPESAPKCSEAKDDDAFDISKYVVGEPAQSFRDNLRNDTKYITSWHSAGWTNDVMTMANLIYLAKITDRIPIISDFVPEYHVGGLEAGSVPFSEMFDIPRLSKAIGVPILEFHQVKDPDSEYIDQIGCWSVWSTVYQDHAPRGSRSPEELRLDVSYTAAPHWIASPLGNSHATFWSLASLAFPETRTKSLGTPLPAPYTGVQLHPDEHLLCYDYLYYVGAYDIFEFEKDFSPAWRHVLYHARWTKQIEYLAQHYLRRAFGLPPGADIPPYITIHSRHGDFGLGTCPETPRSTKCFASIQSFADAVSKVQEELWKRDGIVIPNEYVIMTSDEQDPLWWEGVAEHGFTRIDHKKERIVEIHGQWYPTFIDAVVQSASAGFVGSQGSTMSLIAARRAKEWHGAIAHLIPWGLANS